MSRYIWNRSSKAHARRALSWPRAWHCRRYIRPCNAYRCGNRSSSETSRLFRAGYWQYGFCQGPTYRKRAPSFARLAASFGLLDRSCSASLFTFLWSKGVAREGQTLLRRYEKRRPSRMSRPKARIAKPRSARGCSASPKTAQPKRIAMGGMSRVTSMRLPEPAMARTR